METTIYFVRHGESMFVEGQERSRGLSDKGNFDAEIVKSILKTEPIDYFISSPYIRAVETIYPAVVSDAKEIIIEEDLKEREVGNFSPDSFKEAKKKLIEDHQFAYPEGESSEDAQNRAVKIIMKVLKKYEGKNIVIGTHGDIMTLMLNYFDRQYGYEFWEKTTMPDIYKLVFKEQRLINMTRLWE